LTEAQTAALTVGDVNVGEQLTETMQSTQETLQGITDAASAEAAVPELNAINTKLEELTATVDQLPDDAKKVLADVLGERVTELKTLADNVLGQQGVGDVVRPALEPIIAKLEDWAQAPA
jgi:phosphoglycerate-specific signal transduction histidine kinase